MRRIAVSLCCLFAALPVTAAADTICVGTPTDGAPCSSSHVTLTGALATAAGGAADEVRIYTGTYDGGAAGFDYHDASLVTLVGVGRPVLIGTGMSDGEAVLSLGGGSHSVGGVVVDMNSGSGSGFIGLNLGSGTTTGDVIVRSANRGAIGVVLDGGSLIDSTVDVPGLAGVRLTATGAQVLRSVVTADTAVTARADGSVRTSVLIAQTNGSIGALAFGTGVELDIRGVTLLASGGDNWGVYARGATVNIADSIITGADTAVFAGWSDEGPGTVTGTTSMLRLSSQAGDGSFSCSNCVDEPVTGPGFLSRSDLRLKPTSSAIDAGSAAAPLVGETDLAGAPRAIDGNGDGTVRRDLGAFEAGEPDAPVVSLEVPATAAVAQTVPVTVTGFDADPGDVLWYWLTCGNAGGGGGSEPPRACWFLRAGTYTVTVTVTDSTGRSASDHSTIVVASDSPEPDNSAPVLTRLRIAPKAFRAGGQLPARFSPKPTGASIRFVLDDWARLDFAVRRRMAMGKGGARYRPVGSFTMAGRSGNNRVNFDGRLPNARLAPGRYRLDVVARDGIGNASERSSVAFRITR